MQYTVEHEEAASKGAFYINKAGQRVAEMTYSRTNATMIIIDHTDWLTPCAARVWAASCWMLWLPGHAAQAPRFCRYALMPRRNLTKTHPYAMCWSEPRKACFRCAI